MAVLLIACQAVCRTRVRPSGWHVGIGSGSIKQVDRAVTSGLTLTLGAPASDGGDDSVGIGCPNEGSGLPVALLEDVVDRGSKDDKGSVRD